MEMMIVKIGRTKDISAESSPVVFRKQMKGTR